MATDATDVFDDAVPNGDQTATSGSLTLTSTGVSWTGDIAVGATVTVTGTVTVKNPDTTGNKTMASTLTSAAPGSNCPSSGGGDPRCAVTVTVQIPALTIVKSANVSTTTPGSVVSYTVTVTDSGQTPYTGATFTDPLAGVLDDATYNADASATSGSAAFTSPDLTWTGDLAAGGSATVTYSVTVNSPDTGDKSLANTISSSAVGSTCPPASPSPACTARVTVLTRS